MKFSWVTDLTCITMNTPYISQPNKSHKFTSSESLRSQPHSTTRISSCCLLCCKINCFYSMWHHKHINDYLMKQLFQIFKRYSYCRNITWSNIHLILRWWEIIFDQRTYETSNDISIVTWSNDLWPQHSTVTQSHGNF